ncbi:glycosyltransferase family 2 protein [Hydrogenovibrio marinus]|uniref:Dolichol monophosphate mannose synthase n=1 Tax=Hydrogenovibrio marinus TaxID=28885 RepID=A0A066ZTE8_HYDMR|nr:glycosyltransferase family 2 protein [Hydrogenovibrio marinus]KDN96747.1 dolichol monophosphate mannose synthase [Hydrogenovibrio marinus]BBN58993.1 glycosyl hydrolase [Hydrogenovibrio marinus]
MQKKISIVTPCYNEEANVKELYEQVKNVISSELPSYDYEHIFIDNASTDKTGDVLKEIASTDKKLKIIINSRNFGHIRSPVYGLTQASGDVVFLVVADLQDPPSLIPKFIAEYENGYNIVLGVKQSSSENKLMYKLREFYYSVLHKMSEVEIFKNFTGFGLYDRKSINALKSIRDPYPFFRGMVAEVGFRVKKIQYDQPVRVRGITKNNFYTLYDIGILGLINNSKVMLRMAIFVSVMIGTISFLIGVVYLVMKIVYWDQMPVGVAPLVIGGSFAFSVLLFFIGILGEYIGQIYTQVLDRPLVFEQERINFD